MFSPKLTEQKCAISLSVTAERMLPAEMDFLGRWLNSDVMLCGAMRYLQGRGKVVGKNLPPHAEEGKGKRSRVEERTEEVSAHVL